MGTIWIAKFDGSIQYSYGTSEKISETKKLLNLLIENVTIFQQCKGILLKNYDNLLEPPMKVNLFEISLEDWLNCKNCSRNNYGFFAISEKEFSILEDYEENNLGYEDVLDKTEIIEFYTTKYSLDYYVNKVKQLEVNIQDLIGKKLRLVKMNQSDKIKRENTNYNNTEKHLEKNKNKDEDKRFTIVFDKVNQDYEMIVDAYIG